MVLINKILYRSLHAHIATLCSHAQNIQASSAPIGRVFSTAGESTIGKRNRLQSSNLEREVILQKNNEVPTLTTTRNILKYQNPKSQKTKETFTKKLKIKFKAISRFKTITKTKILILN